MARRLRKLPTCQLRGVRCSAWLGTTRDDLRKGVDDLREGVDDLRKRVDDLRKRVERLISKEKNQECLTTQAQRRLGDGAAAA